MTPRKPSNLTASVHQRLLNISQKRGINFNLLLGRYAIERLLYRLSQSRYSHQFVLKGALLFSVWKMPGDRPTRDVDLLGFGDASFAHLKGVFQEFCQISVEPDGLTFDPDSIRVSDIREDQEYGGQRIQLLAVLGRARISLQVDVGFGDSVSPAALEVEYPTLLDFPAPLLRIYSKESVIAEKLHAMVELDMLNSRLKDFFDIWMMSRHFHFDGAGLVEAIRATFNRRRTVIPSAMPPALTMEFSENSEKIMQWQVFIQRIGLKSNDLQLPLVVANLSVFLQAPMHAAAEAVEFGATWSPGGPWTI